MQVKQMVQRAEANKDTMSDRTVHSAHRLVHADVASTHQQTIGVLLYLL